MWIYARLKGMPATEISAEMDRLYRVLYRFHAIRVRCGQLYSNKSFMTVDDMSLSNMNLILSRYFFSICCVLMVVNVYKM